MKPQQKEKLLRIIELFAIIFVVFGVRGYIVFSIQQQQINEVFSKGCNETTIQTGCYTLNPEGYAVYCTLERNQTTQVIEPYCKLIELR